MSNVRCYHSDTNFYSNDTVTVGKVIRTNASLRGLPFHSQGGVRVFLEKKNCTLIFEEKKNCTLIV